MKIKLIFTVCFLVQCNIFCQSSGSGDGHKYEVHSITATDNRENVGKRESDTELQMVNTGPRTARLKANTTGDKPDDLPTWSGDGVLSVQGSEIGAFVGSATSLISCYGEESSEANVAITIFDINKSTQNDKFPEPIKSTIIEITNYLSQYNVKFEGMTLSGGLSNEIYRDDEYDEPTVAYSHKLNGTVTYTLGSVESNFILFPPEPFDQLNFSITINATGKLVFEVKVDNYMSDVSKPEETKYSGNFQLLEGLYLMGSVDIVDMVIEAYGIDKINLKADASVSAGLKSEFVAKSGDLTVQIGIDKAQAEIGMKVFYQDARSPDYINAVQEIDIFKNIKPFKRKYNVKWMLEE